jgi:iron uptake system EfeUOB component EfeO/EfeM
VYDWFKANVDGGEEVFDALTSAVAAAESELNSGRASDIN